MKRSKTSCHLTILLTLAVAVGLSAGQAHAQINAVFTPNIQTGSPGATLNYSALFTDTDTVAYYIDGASFASGSPYASLLTGFFNGDPVHGDPVTGAFEVMPGQSTNVTNVFSVTLDSTLPPGTYAGTVTFTGQKASDYVSGNGVDTAVGYQDLSVAAVPEASCLWQLSLLSVGILCGAWKQRRHQGSESNEDK